MGINIADNFAYNGKKPLDNRTEYTTLAAMKAVVDANINEGCLAYNKEDGKYYKFLSTNTVDATTGKWREFETGGGGQTYNDFTGATASTAGAHGLVPAPSAGDEGKVLFGNGAWGALPSVDLSVLSNEAFILSYTEKAVGMAPDRKILYAKTIDCGAGPNNTTKVIATGISNFEKGWMLWGTMKSTNSDIWCKPLPSADPQSLADNIYVDYNTGNIRLDSRVNYSNGSQCDVTIFYTKTTDSPLASDVKFAGVTSSGEVIYEKTITGLSVAVSSDWSTLISNLSSVKDYISGHFYFGTSGDFSEYLPKSAQIINGTTLRIDGNGSSRMITKATIRYTKSS